MKASQTLSSALARPTIHGTFIKQYFLANDWPGFFTTQDQNFRLLQAT